MKPGDPPVGEAWIAFEGSRVQAGGPEGGRTVAELAARYGAEFLGAVVAARFPSRFPLLVKLLDCADWLSVQVHPDDEQARRLVGPDEFGKTEAWHFLEVEQGAAILAGVKPGTTPESLEAAIRSGNILDVARKFGVRAGETYLLPAGTLHAIGPGVLLYEVQQSSDTTYRVYDWDRPATAGRKLHIEESVAVTDHRRKAVLTAPPELEGTAAASAVSCPYFALDVLQLIDTPLVGHTEGQTFHILTPAAGNLRVSCGDESVRLSQYETALIAGNAGAYEVRATGGPAKVLRVTVPEC